ncbi:TetR/AcrR family transcriptional regulator [Microvirga arsenatis]|uniref:TetR family transcriptional regulator n=1 Tax=Microvirga arsenatis TaxID=2692265 RepID=A0ABW9YWI3_9HYPH|nr:TetR/AcrR family transcriptional regulator [Microvirga arsenatis]NBJ10354.1 TetR family transcriptional regulator [Microvirga arsenatis]NBJ24747.1 TetR family transcriptional regulator [Microvirga arsenatis]
MRYGKGHKDATHRRIVEVASKQLRKDGVGASGVAGLMASAGLTHGGFYSHFPSKDALIEEALAAALEQVKAWIGSVAESNEDKFEAVIRAYLSPEHRDNPETGCVAGALAPEIARHSPAVREMFTKSIIEHVDMLASLLPASATPQARRSVAMAIIAGTTGMIQLARAVDDEELSDEILESGIAACLSLARSISS